MATEMKSNTHTTTTTKLQLLPLLLLLLQKQFTFQRTDLLNTINGVRITGDDFDRLFDPHSSGCLQHCDLHLGLWLNGDHARILWASMSERLNQMVYKIPPWFVKQQEPVISLFFAWKRLFLKQLGSQLTSSDNVLSMWTFWSSLSLLFSVNCFKYGLTGWSIRTESRDISDSAFQYVCSVYSNYDCSRCNCNSFSFFLFCSSQVYEEIEALSYTVGH